MYIIVIICIYIYMYIYICIYIYMYIYIYINSIHLLNVGNYGEGGNREKLIQLQPTLQPINSIMSRTHGLQWVGLRENQSTENHRFSHEIWESPVFFSLETNQLRTSSVQKTAACRSDCSASKSTGMASDCFLL